MVTGLEADLEAVMFERDEVLKDLHGRLVSAGINPLDPKVQAICEVVNAFYAEKTREVLQKMQAVLSKIEVQAKLRHYDASRFSRSLPRKRSMIASACPMENSRVLASNAAGLCGSM